jgi:uncharacterized protein YbcV (DUF1398 family)
MTTRVHFDECEHYGDLSNYRADLIGSGAGVVNSEIDLEEETCVFTIEVDDLDRFMERFEKTQGYELSSLSPE